MRRIAYIVAFVVLCATLTHASTPLQVTVQGRLTDSTGIPLTGNKGFLFRIFDAQNGGSQIWSGEDHFLSVGEDGLWTAQVGRYVGLNDAVFSDSVRWLDITVDGIVLPRIRLVTSPYAHRISTVDGAAGGHITSKVKIGPNNANTGQEAYTAGASNTASGDYSNIGGGTNNTASGIESVIGGGNANTASEYGTAIGGGELNIADGIYGVIGGGSFNEVYDENAVVAGGGHNRAKGWHSVVGGGFQNNADTGSCTVAGGRNNSASGINAFVGGGDQNTATGGSAAIVGGVQNRARGVLSFIGGGGGPLGDSNATSGDYAVAVGGNSSIARGHYSFVGGGIENRAYDDYTIVVGGNQNQAEGSYGVVVGGFSNLAGEGGTHKFIGGGRGNFVDASYAAIAGGDSNTVNANHGVVAGGRRNRVSGGLSAVLGGQANYAGAAEAVCIGGHEDTALAAYSVTLGGYRNRTGSNGKYSLTAGKRAKANHAGCFVWADSTDADFASSDINQFLVRASGGVGVGTNDPEGPLHVHDGTAGAVTANSNSIAVFESSTAGWLSIMTPVNSEKGILFGEAGESVAGAIVFDQGGGGDDIGFRTGGNVTRMTLDASGNLTVDGCVDGNNTACASDERFKRDIATVSNPLATIQLLRGVTYKWRVDEFPNRGFEEDRQYGLIAQEVQQILPELIRQRDDEYLSVEYNALIPLLIEGMKEQQRIIDRQNERIANLEKKLEQ